MLQTPSRKTKAVALLTGGVLMASALGVTSTPAHADKSKTYKAGAIVLGVLGGILILKGKTLPGAAAAAGAYYAYKKSKDQGSNNNSNRSSNGNVYPDTRYSSTSTTSTNSNDVYPDYQSPDDYGYNGVASSGGNSSIVLK
jgi:hypothetical protein